MESCQELNRADFDSWWEGKADILAPDERRTESCPIARYLRSLGYHGARVGWAWWFDGSDFRPLPDWARDYAVRFDLAQREAKEKRQ